MSAATPERPTTASEVLFRAADALDTKGWCRGTSADEKGRHCALGAIDTIKVGRGSRLRGDALHALNAEVQATTPFGHIVNFNDSQRDKRKVTRLMRRVARKLQANGD